MTATKQKSSSHTILKIKNFVNALLLLLVCEKQQYKVSRYMKTIKNNFVYEKGFIKKKTL